MDFDGLTYTATCRTAQNGPATTHVVEIGSDWSIRTPHDLEAERIGVALGGYCSCLALCDLVMPAARTAWSVWAREAEAPIHRVGSGAWAPAATRSCCRRRHFGSASAAMEHVTSARHALLAVSRQVPTSVLAQLGELESALRAQYPTVLRVSGFVDGVSADQLRMAWDAGLHPARVRGLRERFSFVDGELTADFFVSVVYGALDLDRLEAVLRVAPQPWAAEWLVREAEARGLSDHLEGWLRLTTQRRAVATLVDSEYTPAEVVSLAAAAHVPVGSMLSACVEWASVGCHVTEASLALLNRHGVERVPSAAAIDRLVTLALRGKSVDHRLDRTELAVMLALAGTVPAAEHYLACGLRTAAGVSDAILAQH